jgi:hypothetical protein
MKLKIEGKQIKAVFDQREQSKIADVLGLATMCRQTGIDGAAEVCEGLSRVLVACGYAAADETEGD